jgi:pimeloyl-ACP methyl ester carboxylesterase
VPILGRIGGAAGLALALVVLGAGRPTATIAQSSDAGYAGTSVFTVLLGGARVGSETVSVTKSGTGWLIASTGRLLPPIDLVTTKFEMNYDGDWQPRQLAVEATQRGQAITISTTFGLTTATSEATRGAEHGAATHQILPRSIVLPEHFFGGYEALAARLATAQAGERLPVYIAPQGAASALVVRVAPRHITRPEGEMDMRESVLDIMSPAGTSAVEVWTDARGRLARLALPNESVVVIRDDLSSVMAREERSRNARDEDQFIPGNGFDLAATITRPAASSAPAPAVVLTASPGPQDRDFVSYGVPIYAQLAGALADAGFLTVRYDGRGVGQSGGRTENATIAEYAADAIAVVSWLRKRDEVDDDRIAIVGYGDGGPIAMTAARREKHIGALALIASPGRPGREATLEQQDRLLASLNLPDADRAGRIALQRRVIDAVLSGKGWEGIPPELRQRTDTPWFKSWLQFDPAAVVPKLSQPVLVVQGAVDTEVPALNAEHLSTFARGRKKAAGSASRLVTVPDVNHLLVSATTGRVDEYATLTSRQVAPGVTQAITAWLGDVFKAR